MTPKAARALCDEAFDFACTRPLGDFLDPDEILGAIDTLATPAAVGVLQRRFLLPARGRLLAVARASAVPLGAWLPGPMRDALASLLGAPAKVPRAVVAELESSPEVKEAVRAMLLESLTAVVRKATSGGKGVLGFGARMAGAAGKSLFGGLGEELGARLEERVREFVDTGTTLVTRRMGERLTSDATSAMLGKRRRRAFLEFADKPERVVGEALGAVPWQLFDLFAPALVAHNWARAEVRKAVEAEVRAQVTAIAEVPLGTLLEELGLTEQTREWLRAHGAPLLIAFTKARA